MTKVLIDLPNPLHRMIKSIASSKGEPMKNIIMESLENLVKKEINADGKYSKNENITEKEADEMLRPYIIKLANRIDTGQEDLLSWSEVKKQLKH